MERRDRVRLEASHDDTKADLEAWEILPPQRKTNESEVFSDGEDVEFSNLSVFFSPSDFPIEILSGRKARQMNSTLDAFGDSWHTPLNEIKTKDGMVGPSFPRNLTELFFYKGEHNRHAAALEDAC